MKKIINMVLIFMCVVLIKSLNTNVNAAEDIMQKAKGNFPSYTILKNFDNVPQDKSFTISFSRDVNEYTINNNSIKILDSNMQEVPIDIGFTSTAKVEITPKQNLKCGQAYLLVIKDKIQNRFSRNIKQGVICVIKVKEDKKTEDKEINGDIKDKETTNDMNTNQNTNISVKVSASETTFIETIAPEAINTYKKYNILPSVTIAQAILESGWGKSDKASNFNNLFGIKADKKWTGKTVSLPTKEFINGKYVIENSNWRAYDSWKDSIEDHGNFLYSRPWYSQAGVFEAQNYREQIEAIKKAGYATDPQYVDKICYIIEKYNLSKYDV